VLVNVTKPMLGALRIEVDGPDEDGRWSSAEGWQVATTARVVSTAATDYSLTTTTDHADIYM